MGGPFTDPQFLTLSRKKSADDRRGLQVVVGFPQPGRARPVFGFDTQIEGKHVNISRTMLAWTRTWETNRSCLHPYKLQVTN